MPLLSSRGGGSVKGFGLTAGGYSAIIATGGTISTYGIYQVHTFNSTDTFSVAKVGTSPGASTIDRYIVGAGGAGGGATIHGPSKGGGAGGIARAANAQSISATNYSITVGTGGVNNGQGMNSPGNNGNAGNATNAFSITCNAGNGNSDRTGGNNSDYNGTSTGNQRQAGNGAGAGGNGGSFSGGFGGIGTSTTIVTGSALYYGGGGGGGYWQNTSIYGGYDPTNAPGVGGGWNAAGPNAGCGGGSGYPWGGGGDGANGAVFIRYQIKPA